MAEASTSRGYNKELAKISFLPGRQCSVREAQPRKLCLIFHHRPRLQCTRSGRTLVNVTHLRSASHSEEPTWRVPRGIPTGQNDHRHMSPPTTRLRCHTSPPSVTKAIPFLPPLRYTVYPFNLTVDSSQNEQKMSARERERKREGEGEFLSLHVLHRYPHFREHKTAPYILYSYCIDGCPICF